MTRSATKVRRQRWAPVLALILLGALAFTVSGVFPFRQMLAQGRQVEHAEMQYETLLAENAILEEQVAALHTDLEVERIAREQYGLVRPGEVGYVVAVPSIDSLEESTEVASLPEEETQPWWQSVWDFITGRDLAQDG